MWLKIIWGLITANLSTIVSAITGTIATLTDNETARLTTVVGAQKEVVVAQMAASAAAYHERNATLGGLWWMHVLIASVLLPAVWHEGLVILDSCSFLPGFQNNWPGLYEHHVGSWRVPGLPGVYADHEWQLIMALIGIQSSLVAGGSFLSWLHK